LLPSCAKILTPLSAAGLCDALIMIPAANVCVRARNASAGVVQRPTSVTATSAATSPCASASRIHGADSRPSLPQTTRSCSPPLFCSSTPSALPTRRRVSTSIGGSPVRPRRPSVPKRGGTKGAVMGSGDAA
jgi:hypothetical protein